MFDGGARDASVESARAALDLATAGYRQSVLTALQEVEDNLAAGDSIKLTSSALVLEQLIGKFMLNAAEKPAAPADSQ